jgi:ABC-2 type transport system permease protein
VSWGAVFRKDFRDAIRSTALWAAVAAFVALGGLFTFGYTDFLLPDLAERVPLAVVGTYTLTVALVRLLSGQLFGGVGPIPLVVPLIGLLLGHKAIVGERETGQLKFLLGLPHSRAEVVAGKFLGRSAVALVGLAAGFLVAGLLLVRGPGIAVGPFLALAAATALFVLAHVAVGIGVSAAAPSGTLATVGIVAFYAVFQVAWGGVFVIVEALFLRPDALAPGEFTPPEWFRLLRSLSPANAFNGAFDAALSAVGGIPPEFGQFFFTSSAGGDAGPVPFYLADWFGVVVLLAWVVLPVGLGYLAFRRANLG